MLNWKELTEIPTEICDVNLCVSPYYFVKSEGCDLLGNPIVGFSFYSYKTKQWFPLCKGDSLYPVKYWTDEEF